MLTRRLTIGSTPFLVPVPPVVETVFQITNAPNGAYNHANDPHAIYLNGYIYAGYVDGSSGNVELAIYHIATGTTVTKVIRSSLDANTHVSPSLLIRDSDHRLYIVYSAHGAGNIWRRVSLNSLDTDPNITGGLGTDTALDSSLGGIAYTYPSLEQLTSETNDPLYLFYRDRRFGGSSATLCYSTSVNNGSTWAAQTRLFQNGTRSAYWKVTGNGTDRIDVVTSDGRNPPDSSPDAKLYHMYWQSGDWHQTDGTVISATKPYGPADLTEIYDASDGMGWPMDVVLDGDGNPRCTYAVVTSPTDNEWRYAKWDGSAWVNSTIDTSDGVLESVFAVSVCMDHDDVLTTYAPKKVSGHWEMYRFESADDGATWTPTAVTSGSANEHLHPTCVRNHESTIKIVWQNGTYAGYLHTSLALMGGR